MKKVFLYVILLMAISLATIVAYVSVNGLLKVFAGAGTLGLLFFVGIELAKIIATSAIHTYGDKLSRLYKILLGLGIVVSMAITSIGIYGFLSASYKESFNSMTISDSKVSLLEEKSNLLEISKENINKNITLKQERVSTLLTARGTQEDRLGTQYDKGWTTSAKRTEKLINEANEEITKTEGEIVELINNINIINDSISSQTMAILEIKQNNEAVNELSTLKYLSDVTGKPMDEVMKWFILLLILIGDPMAVLMIIVFNKVINDEKKNKPEPIKPEPIKPEPIKPEPIKPVTTMGVIDNKVPKEDGAKTQFGIKGITIDDIKEKNRNFSVEIPERKNRHATERLD